LAVECPLLRSRAFHPIGIGRHVTDTPVVCPDIAFG
jgi:hypothetical protein